MSIAALLARRSGAVPAPPVPAVPSRFSDAGTGISLINQGGSPGSRGSLENDRPPSENHAGTDAPDDREAAPRTNNQKGQICVSNGELFNSEFPGNRFAHGEALTPADLAAIAAWLNSQGAFNPATREVFTEYCARDPEVLEDVLRLAPPMGDRGVLLQEDTPRRPATLAEV